MVGQKTLGVSPLCLRAMDMCESSWAEGLFPVFFLLLMYSLVFITHLLLLLVFPAVSSPYRGCL